MARMESFEIGGQLIPPGSRKTIDLPLPPLYTHTSVALPVHVIHGRRPGPTLCVLAAIHGDEINGVEIIRRLLRSSSLNRIHGTLLAVPVANVYGFVQQSRYLPDRRDLNRSFPGSERGSMASRLAHTLMTEVIGKCTHGIDYHTAAAGRTNLPQLRVDLDTHPDALALAKAFAPPIIMDMGSRDGTLREACKDIPMILYESGEALRFDDVCIRAGLRGTLRIMRHLEMLPPQSKSTVSHEPFIANDSEWMRAPQSGIIRSSVPLGSAIQKGQVLGVIADPLGGSEESVVSRRNGVLIGMTKMPLVHEGEALFHVACTSEVKRAAQAVNEFHQGYEDP
jgi:uncharacterized protein